MFSEEIRILMEESNPFSNSQMTESESESLFEAKPVEVIPFAESEIHAASCEWVWYLKDAISNLEVLKEIQFGQRSIGSDKLTIAIREIDKVKSDLTLFLNNLYLNTEIYTSPNRCKQCHLRFLPYGKSDATICQLCLLHNLNQSFNKS